MINAKYIEVNFRFARLILLFSLLLILFSQTVLAGEVTNTYCPVTTSEKVDDKYFVDYEGTRIFFCCNSCKKDFLKDPEQYLPNVQEFLKDYDNSGSVTDKNANYEEEQHGEHYAALQKDDSNHQHDVTNMSKTMENQSHQESDEHDHATDHGDSNSFITFMGKFHPIVIHFPIALIMVALLFSIISVLFKSPQYDLFSIKLVYIALISAIISVLFGLAAGSGAEYPSFLIEYFNWHRILGISSTVILGLTSFLAYKYEIKKSNKNAWLYRSVLFLNALIVGITGHFGATLVYGPDYFTP